MRPDAPDAPAGAAPEEGDLRLRLELLRSRRQLDVLLAKLGRPGDPVTTLSLLLDDSAELTQLKASWRYRVAALVAEGAAALRSAPAMIVRPTRALYRFVYRGNARLRGLVRGGRVDPLVSDDVPASEPQAHVLPGPGESPATAGELRISAVLDPFSAATFAPECNLCLLAPETWVEQITAHRPHLLLVESAWTGVEGEWSGKVERAPQILRSIVFSCQKAGIPTVFWNKEDPLHFGAFLETARLFDHILTTDADSVPRYRRLVGHDRVGVMPFGIQPAIHHPVHSAERQSSSVFAGAWYGRLPERCRDFTRCADALALAGTLVIHDRNNGQGQDCQRFPDRYRQHLRPAVSFEETAAVFRSHVIGLNVNTITTSPTMFARRALELAACGASVYGNHSVALHGILGGAAVISDDDERLLTEAWAELRRPACWQYRQRRLQALRKVMREHTWANRVQGMAQRVIGLALGATPCRVFVVARVDGNEGLTRVCAAFLRQDFPTAELLIDAPPGLELPTFAKSSSDAVVTSEDWVAPFHDSDYYGPHYLSDLVDALAWQQGDIVGKGAWHSWSGRGLVEHHSKKEYRRVKSLAMRRALFRLRSAKRDLYGLLNELEFGAIEGQCVSTDAWEYVEAGAGVADSAKTDVPCLPNPSWHDVEQAVARVPAQADPTDSPGHAIDGRILAEVFARGRGAAHVSWALRRGRMELCSLLETSEVATISTALMPALRFREGNRIRVTLQSPRLTSIRFYVEVLGRRGQILSRVPMHPAVPADVVVGPSAKWCRFAIELSGPVVQEIDGIWIGEGPAQALFVPGTNRLALVTNAYPRRSDLYRNAFVHRRVVEYRRRGIGVDVFVVRPGLPRSEYEFEDVLVRECDPASLAATLELSQHAGIAIHVLDKGMWEALQGVLGRQPIAIWIHGSEIQSWHHRSFNFATVREREVARAASEERSVFWKGLFARDWPNVHYVFVSEFFARQTWADLGIQPSEGTWSIIHNPIDTDLFRYHPKTAAMARRILSVRPHASRIYANDLVAQAIRILADNSLFPELSFTLVGDGELWENNFAGLERYPNVRLLRGFMPQREIARLHKDHGVFLAPTRGDTQGVSRDEAMASGLVPVTNAVGAVPEFVDDTCAELCPAEDADALAAAILALATDADRFERKSRNASERVAAKSGSPRIIDQEIDVMRLADAGFVRRCTCFNTPFGSVSRTV